MVIVTSIEQIQELAKQLNPEKQELIIQVIYNMISVVEPDGCEEQAIEEWEALSEEEEKEGISLEDYAKQWRIALWHTLSLAKKAQKFLDKQPTQVVERILKAIHSLPKGDVKPLKRRKPYKRLRVGDYRIIFNKNGDIIDIIDINNQGDI